MRAMEPQLYPLRFKEILRNYAFGDRWIAREFAKSDLPADHRIAETWEVVDRPPESSVVINGVLAGQDLHTLIGQYGEQLLGRDVVRRCGTRFPLLIKFLDASNPLGEQCHPNDAQAAAMRRGDDTGKTEAWYMLRTRPGATIHCGNKPGLSRDQLIEAIANERVRDCMVEMPVQSGDAFLLYAGTMHYSAGGVLFYEIMQNSDITIGLRRLPPELTAEQRWARAQELSTFVHLEERGNYHIQPVHVNDGANRQTFIFACRYFALEKLDLVQAKRLDLDGERFYVLSNIGGVTQVHFGDMAETLCPGQSCLLPACLGSVHLVPMGDAAHILKAYVPDLRRDVVMPLRASGVPDEHILGLGGQSELNDLRDIL